ncbi:MAG: gp33 family protein [Mycobacteriaceae bacterium]
MTTTLSDDLLTLRDLKAERDAANKQFKALDAEFKTQQRRLIERMEAEGTDSLKADGTSFSPVKLEFGTIQDRQAFVAWAQENDPELIEYHERDEQLNALVRRLLDDGQDLPPGSSFYTREYISMRSS